jgi:hypothetical protein
LIPNGEQRDSIARRQDGDGGGGLPGVFAVFGAQNLTDF